MATNKLTKKDCLTFKSIILLEMYWLTFLLSLLILALESFIVTQPDLSPFDLCGCVFL